MGTFTIPFQQTVTAAGTAFQIMVVAPAPGAQSIAISGTTTGSFGVPGSSLGPAGVGVHGESGTFRGVEGVSDIGVGVYGTSKSFDAVVGETNSDAHAGVTGRNFTKGANGGVGVYGTGGQFAAKFDGKLQVNGDANITGTLSVVNDIILAAAAADCAEDFDVATSHEVEPGTVMVLDNSGALRPGEEGYDRKVAGVISGAGEYRPGMVLGRCESSQQRVPIALVGKVYCKVDAQYAAVEVGDLLTTSPTIGHAMKASDPLRAFGAVIGKALRPLHSGQGLVPVLIALQ